MTEQNLLNQQKTLTEKEKLEKIQELELLEQKKEWLNGYKRIEKEFAYYADELEVLRERKIGLSRLISDMPRGVGLSMEDKWIELMEYTDELIEHLGSIVQDLQQKLQAITQAIAQLPDTQRMILVARHIKAMSFHDIQKDLQCSESKMYTDYRQALELLELPQE